MLRNDQERPYKNFAEKEIPSAATLKEALLSAAVFVLQKSRSQYALYTDTCNNQVGCVLLSEQVDVVVRFAIGLVNWTRMYKSWPQYSGLA